ncbi:M23 family peptidase, partial [Streptomyces rubiginosohelvolus]
AAPNTADAQGILNAGTNYVYCKVWGARVGTATQFNHWWLRTDLDSVYPGKNGRNAYVSAYYLSRWGNDEARDNNGTVIPNC